MRKYVWVFGLVVGTLGSGSVASAMHPGVETVNVAPVAVSGCGAQSVTISGTASSYSHEVEHLVVTLDGTEILHDDEKPEAWGVAPRAVGVGGHTVTATIYEGDGHADLRAKDTKTFTVPSCEQSGPPPAPAGPDSSDCCPGPDPVVSSVKKVGRVKGVATAPKLPLKLFWLNETFEKVHSRIPTFEEWSYWANRLLTDKPEYPALYGAMQWHKLRGRTVGT